jgi:predicted nuclease with TOPRIM domain
MTDKERIDKAGAEFKRLEDKLKKLEAKITLLEGKFDFVKTDLAKRYELIAEVCKGLLNIANTELGELTDSKK